MPMHRWFIAQLSGNHDNSQRLIYDSQLNLHGHGQRLPYSGKLELGSSLS